MYQNKLTAPAPPYAMAQAAVRQDTMRHITWPVPNTQGPQAPPFELAHAAVYNLSSSAPDYDMCQPEWNGMKRHCPDGARSSDPLPTQHEINRYTDGFLSDSSEINYGDAYPHGFAAAQASVAARW